MKELKIQFTDEEAVKITTLARLSNMTVSDYVRDRVLTPTNADVNEYGIGTINGIASKYKRFLG